MVVLIRMIHNGNLRGTDMHPGVRITDALVKLGYPKQGHDSWRAWVNGVEVPLGSPVPAGMPINISHRAMGDIPRDVLAYLTCYP